MRELVIAEFITLDGVIQAPGGKDEDTEGGFTHGGWTWPFWHDDIGKHFFQAMSNTDAFLLGRKTWQIHSVFETMNEPFADALNAVNKYVVSRTLESTDAWRNSTVIRDDVVDSIRAMKQQPGKNILLDGSSVLAHTLIENDLVDEFMLHIYPISLGSGKKLYPDGKRLDLKLVESSPLPTGVVYARYRRAEGK
jgi:dihydrofolate reductase